MPSAFDDLVSGMNAICVETFGEGADTPVLFRRSGQPDHSMSGIYDESYVSIRVEDGAEISDVSPALLINLADLPPGTELRQQTDRFVVRGAARRVWDFRPDGFGMVRVLLKGN